MSKAKVNNLNKMDRSLDKILHQVVNVIGSRKLNKNAYDDDLKETWENFRTEVGKLEKEISKFSTFLKIEDGET